MLADVVDKESSHSAPIVGRRDGAVSFLAGCVPNLRLDGLCVDLDGPCGKLDANGRLGVEVELVAGKTTQKVGFTDTRVSDQDDYGGLARRRQPRCRTYP